MTRVSSHAGQVLAGVATALLAAAIFLFALGHPDDDELAPAGLTWEQLRPSNPDLAGYLARTYREAALALGAFALSSLLVLATPFRRGERWAWYAGGLVPALSATIVWYERKTSVRISYGALTVLASLAWLGSLPTFRSREAFEQSPARDS